MPKDLFAPVIPLTETHELFQQVHQGVRHQAARRLMNEIFTNFQDVDKSFIREFQTGGFSARLFELALFAYMQEEGLTLDRSKAAPDFLTTGSYPVAIEVTTTNPPQDATPEEFTLVPPDLEAGARAFVFQLGKALRRKLLHRNVKGQAYWEMPHVAGVPFVIAVGAFHDQHAQWYSDGLLAEYLYGARSVPNYDEQNTLTLTSEPIVEHQSKGKTIPSGLFRLPEAKHLSGVLFSNAHTIAMFNRIGVECGYGSDDVAMCRFGTMYDRDPNASKPREFSYVVGDREPGDQEAFSEGLALFINPWAETPLSSQALPSITYSELLDDGNLLTTSFGFHPFASKTAIFHNKGAETFARYYHQSLLGLVPPLMEILGTHNPDTADE